MVSRTIPWNALLGALVALVALLFATQEARAQTPQPPFLMVNGNGTIAVEPDQAFVRMGVETESASAREAQLATSRVATAILEAMGGLGIEAEALQTSRLQVSPVYERPAPDREGGQPRVVGYRATNTVSVELHDLTRIGPVVDAGIDAGANRIEGVDLGLRDDRAARRLALAAAVRDAREKAETIIEALEITLGPVLEIIDQGVSVPLMSFRDAGGPMAVQESSTPVATGKITVSASLMIRYGIEPGPR